MLKICLNKKDLSLTWKKKETFLTGKLLAAFFCSLFLHAILFGIFKIRTSPTEESVLTLNPIAVTVDLKMNEACPHKQSGLQLTFLNPIIGPEMKTYNPQPSYIKEKAWHEDFIHIEESDIEYHDRD